MSAPENSKAASGLDPQEQGAQQVTKQQVIDGFKALSEVHKNISIQIDDYAKWVERTDLSGSALLMQIELITSLHAKFQ